MAIVLLKMKCNQCGDVLVKVEDITLILQEDGRSGGYQFVCPSCFDVVERWANERELTLLRTSGVSIIYERDDGRRRRRRISVAAPPLTLDDLIDLHFLLEDEEKMWEELFQSF
jgi:hypothetical protein